jgi:hypothetical protein
MPNNANRNPSFNRGFPSSRPHGTGNSFNNSRPSRNQSQPTHHVVAMASSAYEFDSSKLILDSGASNHIFNDIDLLFNYRPVKGLTVHYGNGNTAAALGMGDVILIDKDYEPRIILRDVIYEPKAQINFLSVQQATKAGTTTTTSCLT